MNPREIDIFTEEEATYNCNILKDRVESCILNEEPVSFTDDVYLKLMSQKARRTVHVLSFFLTNQLKKILSIYFEKIIF